MLIGDAVVDNLDSDYWHIWPTAPGGLVTLNRSRGRHVRLRVQYTLPQEPT